MKKFFNRHKKFFSDNDFIDNEEILDDVDNEKKTEEFDSESDENNDEETYDDSSVNGGYRAGDSGLENAHEVESEDYDERIVDIEDDEIGESETEEETPEDEAEEDELGDGEAEDNEPEKDELEEDELEEDELEEDELEEDELEEDELEENELEEDELEEDELEEDELEEDELEEDDIENDEIEDDVNLRYGDSRSWEENRRIYRHKRRVRNQIIAYGIVAVIMVILIAAGVGIGNSVSALIKEKQESNTQEVQDLEENEEDSDNQPEEIIVESPPEIEDKTLDEQLEEIVNNCISVMPLSDKVAGLFVITPEALTGVGTVIQAGEGTQEALSNYAVGGLVYFEDNIKDKEQLSQMLSNTVSMSKYPIFLAVDEEGGAVSRVANSPIEAVKIDDMLTIGAGGDTTAAYEAGVTIGSYLDELGFNLDFAPVADIVTNNESPLEKRSFGNDPSVCADMVSNMVEGIQGTSVSACLKHFPGIGSAKEDTHEGRVETTKSLEEMKNSDFIPFQAGIEAGADFVMVSHITASAVDTEGLPSSLSKTVITDVLRGELGFEGVVITDALNMNAISDYYTSEEAAVNAILAGADMLLMPENFNDAYDGLMSAVQDGRISEERIDESLRRIYRIKYADKLDMN